MRGEIAQIIKDLWSVQAGRENDIVDDFSYPLPVTVICRLLGVPLEDEPLFRAWSDALDAAADVRPDEDTTKSDEAGKQARVEMGQYLMVAERRRGHPGDDMLSAFVNEPDPAVRLTHEELAETAVLLLIAGHETTANLITNGGLMLRRPEHLDQLRGEPDLLPQAVEELLRYEPPVHMRERIPRVDIKVAGTTIPDGTSLVLVLASGNRDPKRFPEPDRFDPTRPDKQHLGFGSAASTFTAHPSPA
ncbi:cytochrome P450 [Streptomyces sp. NPDC057291]|uniref:cytochrome P450 n=1 Tax=Streptomyces sp. NPDC057291 TaxID=3346087 RepID=UPI0036263D54